MNANKTEVKINPSVRPSFCEILEEVKENTEFDLFDEAEKPQAHEACLIITEVLKLAPAVSLKIAGDILYAETVQEIFKQIRHEHIQLVLDNFNRVTYEVHSKKAYLRTALYNSVFELESHYVNQARADHAI